MLQKDADKNTTMFVIVSKVSQAWNGFLYNSILVQRWLNEQILWYSLEIEKGAK